jgi:glycosyltransferase involved in cell wall biosynthesis
MKLIVMIPCLNEEATLPAVLESIPKKIAGIDKIEVLIIDDGSTDKTVEVAKKYGVRHFLRHAGNRGLAHSFRDGLQRAVELGGDIIVLTDGDNQYPQEKIPELVRPVLDGKADCVTADRHTQTIEHFSPFKKFLQKFGTYVLNKAAGTNVPDGTNGFWAWSKDSACQLHLVMRYSFAMEVVIQAGIKRQRIDVIDIKTNPETRKSRVHKSAWQHARRQALVIIRSFIIYRPYFVFVPLGGILLILGLIPFVRFLVIALDTAASLGPHYIQSLIAGAVFLIAAFIAFTLGIVADLIRTNRSLLEDVLTEQKLAAFNTKSTSK